MRKMTRKKDDLEFGIAEALNGLIFSGYCVFYSVRHTIRNRRLVSRSRKTKKYILNGKGGEIIMPCKGKGKGGRGGKGGKGK